MLDTDEYIEHGALLIVTDNRMVEDYLTQGDVVEVSQNTNPLGTFISIVGVMNGMAVFSRRRFERCLDNRPKTEPVDDKEVKQIWY